MATKQVVVVESYGSDYTWDQEYLQALKTSLGDRVTFTVYPLDSKHQPAAVVAANAAVVRDAIRLTRPDLVIVGDDAALELVGSQLDPAQPVVYLGINNNPRVYLGNRPHTITGVLERPSIARNLLALSPLVKGMRRALILFDNDRTSRIIRQTIFGNQDSMRIGNLQVDIRLVDRFADWKAQLLTANQHYQAVWLGLYFSLHDEQGRNVASDDVLAWSNQHTPLPLFGFWAFAVGKHKTIGGLVVSARQQGEAAAKMAEEYLFRGHPLSNQFPVTPSNGDFLFSRSELARFGLTLPANLAAQARLVE